MVRTLVSILLLSHISWANTITEVPMEAPDSEKKPKYEAGIALGAFYLPDYPGADESRDRYFGAPFVFYRGEIFRADRDGGVRSRIINKEKTEFDFSIQAAFPTNSEDNEARQGMEDLDWIGEIGPRFVYHFKRSKIYDLALKLPVRYVFSTDLSDWAERGFTFNPQLMYKYYLNSKRDMYVTTKIEGTWATKKLMDYFYEVDENDATADRPEYNAQSGYMATTAGISLTKNIDDKFFIFTSISLNYYQDAANKRSPLLKDETTESYSAGFAWAFYQSEEKED